MYNQKLSAFWWTRNHRYLIYFLRELTGLFIAFYTIFFLIAAIKDPTLQFLMERTSAFRTISWLGLAAAVFHTVTWLFVSVRISTIPLKKATATGLFLLLILAWLALSYAVFYTNFFYSGY